MSVLKILQTMLRCHSELERVLFVFPEHVTHESSREAKKKVVADYKHAMSQAIACLEEAIAAFTGEDKNERKHGEMAAFAALIKQTSVTFDELKSGALFAIVADVRYLLTAESAKIDRIFTREAEKQNFDGPCMRLLQYAAQVSALAAS